MHDVDWRISRVDVAGDRHRAHALHDEGLVRVVHEVPHDAVVVELPHSVHQVLPHQVLGERERGDGGLLHNLEPGHVADSLPHPLEHLGNIDPTIVGRKTRLHRREVAAEVFLELLEEGRVEVDIVLVARNVERRRGASANQLHRDEQERGPVDALVGWAFSPPQKTNREVDGVRPALGQIIFPFPVQRRQPVGELVLLNLACQLVLLEGLPGKLHLKVGASAFVMEGGIAVGDSCLLTERDESKPPPVRETVF